MKLAYKHFVAFLVDLKQSFLKTTFVQKLKYRTSIIRRHFKNYRTEVKQIERIKIYAKEIESRGPPKNSGGAHPVVQEIRYKAMKHYDPAKADAIEKEIGELYE